MEVLAVVVLASALAELRETAPAPAELRHVEAFLAHSGTRLRRRYRPLYHLSAPLGWLSDPAAFVYFKRKYHLFYQYHPYEGAWGPPAWGHAASADLAAWAHYPAALLPREAHDAAGCLAGSAHPHRRHLALFYTGRAHDRNRTRYTQSVAVSADAVLFNKYAYDPVLRHPPPHADDWRNPKAWRHGGAWYMVVGASVRRRGALLRYTSPDLHSWRANGTAARSLGDMGTAWESPDLFELDGYCVLVLSARGVSADEDRFRNAHQTGYVLGRRRRLDCARAHLDELEVSTATFEELDRGHDFYAAKTTRAPDGRRLMVAWLGVWGGRFEESRYGWAGTMTLVRELRVGRGGRLLQAPVSEMRSLREELIENARYEPGEEFAAGARAFELLANASSSSKDASLALEWGGAVRYTVSYTARRGRVSVERGGAEGEEGVRRADWAPAGPLRWRVFVDRSSVEVFCGAGEVVFSSRVYPRGALTVRVLGQAQLHITQYRIKPSIGYDHKLTKYLREHVLNAGRI